jgi:rare lipoprotein A (peptidoglycan hydrolase)
MLIRRTVTARTTHTPINGRVKRIVNRVAAVIIAFTLGSLILQPTTLYAAPSGSAISGDEPPSSVAQQVAPETYQGSFKYTSATDMLAALGVTVYPQDRVEAFPDPSLGIGSEIRVYRAHPITIHDGAQAPYIARTWSTTVAQLAIELQLNLAQQDETSILLNGDITKATDLTITRVDVATINETEPISFTTQEQESADLDLGVEKVTQEGQNGVLQKTYTLRRENGVEVSRTLSGSEVLQAAVPEIVVNGTKVIDLGEGGASWYSGNGVGPLTAANKTLPKGTMVRVVNLANDKSVIVRINDRGPYVGGRIIDLSPDAFAQIAPLGSGVVNVRMELAS